MYAEREGRCAGGESPVAEARTEGPAAPGRAGLPTTAGSTRVLVMVTAVWDDASSEDGHHANDVVSAGGVSRQVQDSIAGIGVAVVALGQFKILAAQRGNPHGAGSVPLTHGHPQLGLPWRQTIGSRHFN